MSYLSQSSLKFLSPYMQQVFCIVQLGHGHAELIFGSLLSITCKRCLSTQGRNSDSACVWICVSMYACTMAKHSSLLASHPASRASVASACTA